MCYLSDGNFFLFCYSLHIHTLELYWEGELLFLPYLFIYLSIYLGWYCILIASDL